MDRVRITPAGDLDVHSAAGFVEDVQAALAGADVLVDLSAVRFVDSSGLSALIRARLLAVERDRQLWLTHPPAQLVRLMAMTATSGQFRFIA